jgi:hypothetical protein
MQEPLPVLGQLANSDLCVYGDGVTTCLTEAHDHLVRPTSRNNAGESLVGRSDVLGRGRGVPATVWARIVVRDAGWRIAKNIRIDEVELIV